MRHYFKKIALILLLTLIFAAQASAETSTQEQLENRAVNFLDFLDRGDIEGAWLKMSALFQAFNNQTQWQGQQQAIHAAYGQLISRQFHHISYRRSYNLSPDGEHVVIQFKSSYHNKAETFETVVFDCSDAPECSIREYVIR